MPTVIYAGDFNATPLSALYELILTGNLVYQGRGVHDLTGTGASKFN
jgi:endonuclease/exonuclease/phosphatase family metal-dependent hydrolase